MEGKIQALSLTQPWSTLVVLGAKRIETRNWRPYPRGTIAIHASKTFPTWARVLCEEEPFRSVLRQHGLTVMNLPLGAVLGTVELVGAEPTEVGMLFKPNPRIPPTDSLEYAFGDFGPDRWMWFLERPEPFDVPVPAKGMLGFWTFEPVGVAL